MIADDDTILTWEYTTRDVVLKSMPIPRQDLEFAIRTMKTAPALLGPGRTVELDIQIGEVRFAREEDMLKALAQAATRRLEQNELQVRPNGDVVFTVHYTEAAGPGTEIVEGIGLNRRVVGKTTQTEVICQCSMKTKDGKELWLQTWHKKPSQYGVVRSPKPEALRQAAISTLMLQFSRMDFPFFIPQDSKLPQLPVETAMHPMRRK